MSSLRYLEYLRHAKSAQRSSSRPQGQFPSIVVETMLVGGQDPTAGSHDVSPSHEAIQARNGTLRLSKMRASSHPQAQHVPQHSINDIWRRRQNTNPQLMAYAFSFNNSSWFSVRDLNCAYTSRVRLPSLGMR